MRITGFTEVDVPNQYWIEPANGQLMFNLGVAEKITADANLIAKEFFDYSRTPRGAHPRSTTEMSVNSVPALMRSFPSEHLDWISPRPAWWLLVIRLTHASSAKISIQPYQAQRNFT